VLNRIDNLTTWVPTIQSLYTSFELAGYNKDAIIELLRADGIMSPVQEDMKAETFYKAAQELHDMDVRRGSWMNEDPNWESTASALDTADFNASQIHSQKSTARASSRSVISRANPDAEPETDKVLPPPPVRDLYLTRLTQKI